MDRPATYAIMDNERHLPFTEKHSLQRRGSESTSARRKMNDNGDTLGWEAVGAKVITAVDA